MYYNKEIRSLMLKNSWTISWLMCCNPECFDNSSHEAVTHACFSFTNILLKYTAKTKMCKGGVCRAENYSKIKKARSSLSLPIRWQPRNLQKACFYVSTCIISLEYIRKQNICKIKFLQNKFTGQNRQYIYSYAWQTCKL